MRAVRPERTLERYSRGAELVGDVRKLWRANARRTNDEINEAIEVLCGEYDLTNDEWYYWSDVAGGRGEKDNKHAS